MDEIIAAIKFLAQHPAFKRLDGEGWTVYYVGDIIRVDIKAELHSSWLPS